MTKHRVGRRTLVLGAAGVTAGQAAWAFTRGNFGADRGTGKEAGPAALRDDPPLHGGQYTLNEMLVLQGFCIWGAPPGLDVSREVVAPNSALGFYVRFDSPGSANYETYLARPIAAYDTLEFDLFRQASAPDAHIVMLFHEISGNRLVAWEQGLAALDSGRWIHVSVPREKMRPERQAFDVPKWGLETAFAVAFSGGPATVYLDNVRLTGVGAAAMPLYNTDDDGMILGPTVSEPVQPALPPGIPVFTLGMNRLEAEPIGETPDGLRKAVGSDIGIALGPVSCLMLRYVDVVRGLKARGMPTVHYSQMMWGYNKFLTKRQAWGVTGDGRSLNWDHPTTPILSGNMHDSDLTAPGVTEAARHRIDAIGRAGLGTWMVADYVIPYFEFGHSPAMIRAFREDLLGKDAGLFTRDGAKREVIHFPDYFRDYNGFYPEPRDAGVSNWDAYERPGPRDQDPLRTRREILYWHLAAYEWLKLADRTCRYFKSKGGQGVWPMPNNENVWSPDFVYAMRSEGGGGMLPEWFGRIVSLVECGYSSLPFLHEAIVRGGTRMAMDLETGAGGHGAPYWDWRVAYVGTYGLTAMSQAQNVVIDFLDESPYSVMRDRKNLDQYVRLRDGVTEASAGRGRVIYLHFTAKEPSDPTVSALNVQVAKVVAEMAGIRPLCEADDQTAVQIFNVRGGQTALIWDAPSQDRWKWEYRPGIAPLEFDAPGVSRSVTVPAAASGRWLVYDFWGDRQSTEVPASGSIELRLTEAIANPWYLGPNTPTFRATIARARETRAALQPYATADLHAVSMARLPEGIAAHQYLARDAGLSGGAFPFKEEAAPSGSPYIGAYWVPGALTTFAVDAPHAGRYRIAVLYANPGADPQSLGIYVDGAKAGTDHFVPTGSGREAFRNWTYRVLTLDLKAGANKIGLKAEVFDGGPVYLDRLTVWAAEL